VPWFAVGARRTTLLMRMEAQQFWWGACLTAWTRRLQDIGQLSPSTLRLRAPAGGISALVGNGTQQASQANPLPFRRHVSTAERLLLPLHCRPVTCSPEIDAARSAHQREAARRSNPKALPSRRLRDHLPFAWTLVTSPRSLHPGHFTGRWGSELCKISLGPALWRQHDRRLISQGIFTRTSSRPTLHCSTTPELAAPAALET
jgi:hypothetical protein